MQFVFLVAILLFASAIASKISELSVDETQTLLKEWGLHRYLGNEFKQLSFDGRALELLDMADFEADRSLFPQATRAHWKVLLSEIKSLGAVDVSGRKLAAKKTTAKKPDGAKKPEPKIDFSDFRGVYLEADKSLISFGKSSDVKLVRTSQGELTMLGKTFKVGQLSAKNILLGDSSITARLDKLEAAIAKLGGKEKDLKDDVKTTVRLSLKKGLIYHLPLDEGKGTTTRVIGGKSSKATLRNGATWDNGKHGSAVYLDGSNDYISAPGFSTTLMAMTACAWVKFQSTNSGGERQYLIDFRGDGAEKNGQIFYLVADEVSKTAVKGVARFGDGPEVITDTIPIKLGSFNHFCASRTTSGQIAYWVDGKKLKQAGTSKKKFAAGKDFRVGTYAGGTSGQHFTHGSICGVRVYNRALDEAEFRSIYDTLGACDGIKPAVKKDFTGGLIYHVPMSSGTGPLKVLGSAPMASTGGFRGGAKWEGKSVKFDGSNDYLSVPGFRTVLHDMTVCAWAKLSSTYSGGGRQYLVDMRGDGTANNGEIFYLIVDEVTRGKRVKGVARFGDGPEVITNPINIKLGSWNHYCAVRRVGIAGGIMYYVDGKLAKTAGSSKSNKKFAAPNKFRIGTFAGGSSGQYFMHGNMCSVRIYNKALHAYDINSLFHAGVCH